MLIGVNELQLNEATVVAALQHYFDSVLFAEGKAPRVTGVSEKSSGSYGSTTSFHVKVEQEPAPPAGGLACPTN